MGCSIRCATACLAVAGIPFAIGGGLIALYFAGLDFSVSAAIGFISLFGVAVMDGILNITYFRELRAQGMGIAEAVFHGAEQRMRPMLMTALSAGVGLFPAAISHGIGSQVQRPLATVVVGGMFIGPLLLLVVAPALRKIFLSRDETASGETVPLRRRCCHRERFGGSVMTSVWMDRVICCL